MKTLLFVFGTRPETIKCAPVILKAKQDPRFKVLVCSTGQHREMIRPLFDFFGIKPDFDLDLMRPGQSLIDISMGVMAGLNKILLENKIDAVVVQGDTTSGFIGSLVAFYNKVSVVHIEAGLRSGDIYSPFPEEFNRKGTALVSKVHLAPTEPARDNLLREHYPAEDVFVTGNTGIDALFEVKKKIESTPSLRSEIASKYSFLNPNRKMILVTVHRRESFGRPMEEVMKGLLELSRREDIELLIPLHMNPQVRASAQKIFGDNAQWIDKGEAPKAGNKIWLCEPVDYVPFIYLMDKAHMIITDSGGVQEEAPSLGKPILVAREKTERPEAIAAGTSKLIPLEQGKFYKMASEVLDTPEIYNRMSQAKNPFGDGQASEKILNILETKL
ncbi:UDP-N-acetylglucosamine 2-epimerase (non-hydrolyzing) [Bdellovibrio sp. SKB1291214]|uniref:non-hydrolyzing UDP-N-acetylglucosamine 2-epimerase n=1 Tax=Bdellovibrio sp. SKB1291214 TaxID=1732569 RepID=UPI000B519349|nr:UDP-N-acetylglucosamine 2-epimerase (non-hydrolyzing) [Bdellovibrio sp. SKB1291214]UYL08538.1 UDP-N-acetylglucosamine 2-epimerase (non-hydrolyzing) [Bdellovibrio sp. SKB1291214]